MEERVRPNLQSAVGHPGFPSGCAGTTPATASARASSRFDLVRVSDRHRCLDQSCLSYTQGSFTALNRWPLMGLPLSLLGSVAAVVLASCAQAGTPGEVIDVFPDSGVTVADWSGSTLRFTEPPKRVVSLVPAVTSMLVSLGAGNDLAGRTDFDTISAVLALPSVGDGLRPSLEHLLILEPDLVIRYEGPQDPSTGPALDARDIPHMGVRTDRIEDVAAILVQLGRIMGREAQAGELVERFEVELEEVRQRVAKRPAVRAAYLLPGDPPWVVGSDTYLGEILEIAGAENVFGDLGRPYAPVSIEGILMRAPDAFVVAEGTAVDERFRAHAPVYQVSRGIETPGLTLGTSARELARALHPGALP